MKIVLAVAAVFALTGCLGPSEEEKRQAEAEKTKELVQTAVRARLKDPVSAQFGALAVVAPDRACQTVNARNGFGGYMGDQQAFVMKVEGTWQAVNIANVSPATCTSIIKDLK